MRRELTVERTDAQIREYKRIQEQVSVLMKGLVASTINK